MEEKVREKEQLEFTFSQGSVPCIPRAAKLPDLKRMVSWNVLFSTLLSTVAVVHASTVVLPMALSAVSIIFATRGQTALQGSSTPFTPLHLYFIDEATGNDANTGLSTSQAWLTPNHAVVCGDVILVKPNAGYPSWNNFGASTGPGTVSNCPSTSGGIDGAGGINFAVLLCAGDVGSCKFTATNPSGANNFAIAVNHNNWAIEGMGLSYGYNRSGSGFGGVLDTSATLVHHVAWINNLAWTNASAFTVSSGGANAGYGDGADYWAIVGNYVQDSAGRCDGFWTAAIAIIGTINLNTNAGTHVLVEGNAVLNSQQVGCSSFAQTNATTTTGAVLNFASVPAGVNGTNVYDIDHPSSINGGQTVASSTSTTVTLTAGVNGTVSSGDHIQFSASASDGESIMDDSIDCKGNFASPVIHRNNVVAESERFGIHHFFTGNTGITVKDYNNTVLSSSLGNWSYDLGTGSYGEINFAMGNDTTAIMQAYNNIVKSTFSARPDTGIPYAIVNGNVGTASNVKIGNVAGNPSSSENIAKSAALACNGTCDGGNNVVEFNSQSFGTNTYVDPAFNNQTDLLTNRMGTPNCTGFASTVACLGYNYATQTLTNPSVLYDIQPTAGGTAGKGYQLPKPCVASDPDFPTWLKGVVYLQASGWVNGATITMNDGLITKPCGL